MAAAATMALTDNEITPRQQIVSTAFAMRAKVAESVDTNAISSAMLATGAVGSTQLAGASVTSAKLGAAAVLAANIGNLNVTTAKIDNLAVINDKLANSSVTTAKLANTSVTTDKLANTSVTLGKIADNAVDNTKLRDSAGMSVIGRTINTTGDPADIVATTDGHVLRRSGTSVGFGTVGTAGIADSAITGAKIASDAIVSLTQLTANSRVMTKSLEFWTSEGPSGAFWQKSDTTFPKSTSAANGEMVLLGNPKLHLATKNNSAAVMTLFESNVGIGTTTPRAPLEVRGSTSITQNHAFFIRGAGSNSPQSGIANNAQGYSIVAEMGISAYQFCSTSDARIKDGVSASDIQQDLATIQQLRVKDYRMVDKVGLGNGLKKGFIAQEVEQVIPEAVTMGTEFVPDVYALASSVKWNAGNQNLALTMPKAHGLKVGDRVQLYADDSTLVLDVVSVPSALEMVLGGCKKEVELVFVFGKQVLDFRTVNYDQIFTTGIGAIQEIKREKDAEIQALRDENATLRRELAATDASLETRLIALERLMAQAAATETVSLKTEQAAK